MVPVAEIPAQDIGPWREALDRLLRDAAHWEELARASRSAAMKYSDNLSVEPFEALLQDALRRPRSAPRPALRSHGDWQAGATLNGFSPDKRRLLALRLRKRASASTWFPGMDPDAPMRLFCFPYAGGGAGAFWGWKLSGAGG